MEVGFWAVTMAVTVRFLSLVVTDVETPMASSVDAQLILRVLTRPPALLEARLICWLLAAAAAAKRGEATLPLCAESSRGCFRRIMAGPAGML
jgi:hypothetical protein